MTERAPDKRLFAVLFHGFDIAVGEGAEFLHGKAVALIFVGSDVESGACEDWIVASEIFVKKGVEHAVGGGTVKVEMVAVVASVGAGGLGHVAGKCQAMCGDVNLTYDVDAA